MNGFAHLRKFRDLDHAYMLACRYLTNVAADQHFSDAASLQRW